MKNVWRLGKHGYEVKNLKYEINSVWIGSRYGSRVGS